MSLLTVQFRFLDRLRKSGSINMWGAAGPLAAAFSLPISEAREIHSKWMKSFSDSLTAEERAATFEPKED